MSRIAVRGSQRFESPPVRSDFSIAQFESQGQKPFESLLRLYYLFTFQIGFRLRDSIRSLWPKEVPTLKSPCGSVLVRCLSGPRAHFPYFSKRSPLRIAGGESYRGEGLLRPLVVEHLTKTLAVHFWRVFFCTFKLIARSENAIAIAIAIAGRDSNRAHRDI